MLIDAQDNIKIADFGLGRVYQTDSDSNSKKTACGSPYYASPEVVAGEIYAPVKADIWGATVTLFYMTTGILPFQAENQNLLFRKVLDCDYDSIGKMNYLRDPNQKLPRPLKTTGFGYKIQWKDVSNELRAVFKTIFVRDHTIRPGFKSMKKMKWLQLYILGLDNSSFKNKCNC